MFVVIVDLEIKTGFEDAFRTAIISQASKSLDLEEDCLRFDVLQNPDQIRAFTLCEAYTDESVFNNVHRKTPHYANFAETTASWVESKKVKSFTRIWPE